MKHYLFVPGDIVVYEGHRYNVLEVRDKQLLLSGPCLALAEECEPLDFHRSRLEQPLDRMDYNA